MRPEPDPVWTLNSGQKVQPKYGSGTGSRSIVDPPNIDSIFHSHMVIITLDDSSYNTCIISSTETYILHTHEQKLQKMEFTLENGIDQ